MPRTWLQIRDELAGGRGIEYDPAPGRVFIVGPSHSFAELAEAIDGAFGRWDLSHLHVFELADGRQIGFADVDPGEHAWLDHDELKGRAGAETRRRVRLRLRPRRRLAPSLPSSVRQARPARRVRPGPAPKAAGADLGLGSIPDQYGRESAEKLGLEG